MAAAMTASRPPLHPPVRRHQSAPRIPALPGAILVRSRTVASRTSKGERRRGAIAAVTVAFLMVGLLSGYGVHRQMSQAAARAEARSLQTALATGAALQSGAVLFVPEYGGVCRRRWIDNATWLLRDGGETDCDQAANWQATVPPADHKVGQRLDAIRSVFQARAAGKLD